MRAASGKWRLKAQLCLVALSLSHCLIASGGEVNRWAPLSAIPSAGKMRGPASDMAGKCRYSLYRKHWREPFVLLKTDAAGKVTKLGGVSLVTSELLAWSLAFDPVKGELLAVGPGAKEADLGWTVVLAYNPKSKQWRRLEFGDKAVREAHASRLAVLEKLRDLVGRTRAYWYRDNSNKGTESERKDLTARCKALQGAAELAKHLEGLNAYAALIGKQQLLDALKQLRALERKFGDEVEALAPVPSGRLRSPVIVDKGNKALVLFGGDHEDYLLNDTWVLDLKNRKWRRANPAKSPTPRAGHALGYLPKSGLIVMWDGYLQTNSRGYRSKQWKTVPDRGAWLYDVKKRSWKYQAVGGAAPKYRGFIDDYGNFAQTDLRTGPGEVLYVRIAGDRRKKTPDKYWSAKLNLSAAVESGKMFATPNTKLYRTGVFLAAHCEYPAPGKPVVPEQLPANAWTPLPASPRKIHGGQRVKDWSSASWDPDRDQILHWGGGHCDGSYSAPAHWSPQSGRMCEGYDAEEQYGHQGGGISFTGRAKVPTHSYRSYAYDPVRKALVTLRGNRLYLYDPLRMDWTRRIDGKAPFITHCYTMILASTPHGVTSWAGRPGAHMGGPRGLWLLDGEGKWKQLVAPGKMPNTNVDGSAAVYDRKRDCLWFFTNGGYGKASDGRLHRYEFKTGKFSAVQPKNIKLGKVNFCRETVYIEHCDWLLNLQTYRKNPRDKSSPAYNRVYDCARNKWMLVDHGPNTAKVTGVAHGICYDAKRKLVYSITNGGAVWALKVVPGKAKIVEGK